MSLPTNGTDWTEEGIDYIAAFSDSRTVVNQVNDAWQRSGHLADYRERARAALDEFKGWQLSWVPREWNKEADELVDEVLAGIEHASN